jgi:WD40 repeat protein
MLLCGMRRRARGIGISPILPPDGLRLAAFGFFWDSATGDSLDLRCGNRGPVAISSTFVASKRRNGFQVVQRKDLTEVFFRKEDALNCLAISPDEQWLAVGRAAYGAGGDLFNLSTHKRVQIIADNKHYVLGLAFSPDSQFLAMAKRPGMIQIISMSDFSTVHDLVTKADNYCLDWSPDGQLLAAVGEDKQLRLWSMPGAASLY